MRLEKFTNSSRRSGRAKSERPRKEVDDNVGVDLRKLLIDCLNRRPIQSKANRSKLTGLDRRQRRERWKSVKQVNRDAVETVAVFAAHHLHRRQK
jgi:hypothetical protein